MKRLFIITNPLAADGRTAALLERSHILDSAFERILLPAQDDAVVAAALKSASPCDTAGIVVFGGDGTANRCLKRLTGTGIPVAIFPAGTVNDLALELGMTASWDDLQKLIAGERYGPLSLLQVNGREFAVYGTLGLGAETSKRLQSTRAGLKAFRQRFPRLQTPLFTVLTVCLTNGYRKKLRLTLDGIVREVDTPGIYVVNQRYLNRRVDMGLDRERNPGRFRLIVFKTLGRRELLRAVMKFSQAGSLSAIQAKVDVFDVKSAVVESLDGQPIYFVADGEPVAEHRRLSLGIDPEPLIAFRGPLRSHGAGNLSHSRQ